MTNWKTRLNGINRMISNTGTSRNNDVPANARKLACSCNLGSSEERSGGRIDGIATAPLSGTYLYTNFTNKLTTLTS